MTLYFFIHDAQRFHQELRPALTAAWRQRSFEPCQALCQSLLPRIEEFLDALHSGHAEGMLAQVSQGLPFQRVYWRHLVGEVLLYGAEEVPEMATSPDTLCCILALQEYRADSGRRDRFAAIEQAHFGTRDLVLGGFYRPDAAGYNDTADVVRLAEYLRAIHPEQWTRQQLQAWRENTEEEELGSELDYARERFVELRHLYSRLAAAGRLLVAEML